MDLAGVRWADFYRPQPMVSIGMGGGSPEYWSDGSLVVTPRREGPPILLRPAPFETRARRWGPLCAEGILSLVAASAALAAAIRRHRVPKTGVRPSKSIAKAKRVI